MAKLVHAEEPVVIPSSEPLPSNPDLLVAQIRKYAAARRLAATQHDQWCRCTPCKVRIYNENRVFARRTVA